MKQKTLTTLAALLMAAPTFASDEQVIGVVNFGSCLTDSKAGKKEQENLDSIRKEIVSRAQETEKELQEIRAKLDDPDFMDGVTPKAETELNEKRETLEQELARLEQQYNQIMQFSQYQMAQKMVGDISKAAEKVAANKKLSYVINKDACFFVQKDFDVTADIIQEMNLNFDQEAKNNIEKEADALNQSSEPQAG